MKKLMKLYVVLFTSLAAFCGGVNASNSPTIQNDDVDFAMGQMIQFKPMALNYLKSIDRSFLDIESALDKTNYEHAEIVNFVSEQIYFEQYPGLLRGPLGTLRSRAGNALDQSVLLAKLLKDAGYDAIVVRGTLPTKAADQLIRQMLLKRVSVSSVVDLDLYEQTRQQLKAIRSTQGTGGDVSKSSKDWPGWAREHASLLKSEVEKSGVTIEPSTDLVWLLQEAKDYYWVRYRTETSGEWNNAHPAFISPAPNLSELPVQEYFAESIPDELQHRIRIQPMVERKWGSKVEAFELMDPFEQPAANLCGNTINYMNVPNGLGSLRDPSEEQIVEAVESSRVFSPILEAGRVFRGTPFDLSGNLIDPMVANSMMAGVFAEVAENFNASASAISSLGKKDTGEKSSPITAVTKQWLKITLIAPGGSEKQFERTIFSAEGSSVSAPVSLAQHVSFTAACGAVSNERLLDSYMKSFVAFVEAMENSPSSLPSADLGEGANFMDLLFLSMADMPFEQSQAVANYRSEPTLVGRYQSVWIQKKGLSGFDIVSSTRRTFGRENGQMVWDSDAAMRKGVWETTLELYVVPWKPEEGFSTVSAFGGLNTKPVEELLIVTSESQLDSLQLNDSVASLLRTELENGYVIALPASGLQDQVQIGWWKVDPDTGATVGKISTGSGWGSITTEKITELMNILQNTSVAAAQCAFRVCSFLGAAIAMTAVVNAGIALATALVTGDLGALQALWDFGVAITETGGVAAIGGEAFMLKCIAYVFFEAPICRPKVPLLPQ